MCNFRQFFPKAVNDKLDSIEGSIKAIRNKMAYSKPAERFNLECQIQAFKQERQRIIADTLSLLSGDTIELTAVK